MDTLAAPPRLRAQAAASTSLYPVHRSVWIRMLALGTVLPLALLTAVAPSAQTAESASNSGSAAAYVAPRASDGVRPDLNGIWQAMNEANYDIERHLAKPALATRTGPHGPVPADAVLALGAVGAVPPGMGVIQDGGRIPYRPAALAKRAENQRNWAARDPEVKCYLPGIPRANYMPHPFQIFQGDGQVFFAYQYAGAVRDILFTDPGPAPIDAWMGQNVGRWDGDSLVIKVTGQNDQTWFDRAGNHHSAEITVVERFTPISPHHLHYEATITDPVVLTQPFTISMPLYRRMEADAQLLDFKCVEFVEELLYGKHRRHPLPPQRPAAGSSE